MRVRSLMTPPGIPENLTRQRFVAPGEVRIRGRAWSGVAPISQVEVAVDRSWHVATLDAAPVTRWAWQAWSWTWRATPGEHVLACRATDAAGNLQPIEQARNILGLGNNSAQQVAVTVS